MSVRLASGDHKERGVWSTAYLPMSSETWFVLVSPRDAQFLGCFFWKSQKSLFGSFPRSLRPLGLQVSQVFGGIRSTVQAHCGRSGLPPRCPLATCHYRGLLQACIWAVPALLGPPGDSVGCRSGVRAAQTRSICGGPESAFRVTIMFQ